MGLKRRIVQQFIGVLDHSLGYLLYRRLPVVKKGVNVNLTILVDMMIVNGHLKDKKRLLLQWDGASENVNQQYPFFCVWILSMGLYFLLKHCHLFHIYTYISYACRMFAAYEYGGKLLAINVGILLVGHTHFDIDQVCFITSCGYQYIFK